MPKRFGGSVVVKNKSRQSTKWRQKPNRDPDGDWRAESTKGECGGDCAVAAEEGKGSGVGPVLGLVMCWGEDMSNP